MKILKTERISSTLYVIPQVVFFILLFVGAILAFLFLPEKGENFAFIERYSNSNMIIFIGKLIIVLIVILILFIGFILPFFRIHKKGIIVFSDKSIDVRGKVYNIRDIDNIVITFNPRKFKPIDNRQLFRGGGNNWIKFRDFERKHSMEFIISSKEDEMIFLELINLWSTYKEITTGKSKERKLLSILDSYINKQ